MLRTEDSCGAAEAAGKTEAAAAEEIDLGTTAAAAGLDVVVDFVVRDWSAAATAMRGGWVDAIDGGCELAGAGAVFCETEGTDCNAGDASDRV